MLSSGYDLEYDDVIDCLEEIFHKNSRFCKAKVEYGVNEFTDNGVTKTDSLHPVGSIGYHPIQISVGVKSLVRNMTPDGRVKNEDAVRALFQGFHESAHLWQHVIGYRQTPDKASISIFDMARTRSIATCFSGYGKFIYVLDTSEQFANQYGCYMVQDFIKQKANDDKRYSLLDIDTPICSYCKKLYGSSWHILYSCNTVEDLVTAFDKMISESPYRKKLSECSGHWPDENSLRAGMKNMLGDDELVERLLTSRNGVEETETLCQYIGKHKPSCFRGLLCIKDEYVKNNISGVLEKVTGKVLHVVPTEFIELYNKEQSDSERFLSDNDDDNDGPNGPR